MNILGIVSIEHDPVACIFQDGKLLALAEEERFVRVKHAKGHFPIQAINFCLETAQISLKDVDYISIGWDVYDYINNVPKHFSKLRKEYRNIIDPQSIAWQEKAVQKFQPETYRQSIINHFHECGFATVPPIEFVDHHYSHALTAYYGSGFGEDAIVLTIDGHGQTNSTVLWEVKNGCFNILEQIKVPHSLGWFYAAITKFLGFKVYDGEGKTMGLAPYGNPNEKFRNHMEDIIKLTEHGYEIDPSYISFGPKTIAPNFTDKLANAFGRRPENGHFNQEHKDLAYEAQRRLEETAAHLVSLAIKKTGIKNLCLAGGVSLNCKMNGYIWGVCDLKNIFIQPMSNDEGTALGSAISVYLNQGGTVDNLEPTKHVYWGPEFQDSSIEDALIQAGISYRISSDITQETATMLSTGKLVGWFQGKMEVGPRALGHRSILADPRRSEMKNVVNERVKFREIWRPFCPSILYERAADYLENWHESPFMILTFKVKSSKRTKIPAVVHVDYTTRPQLVKKESNALFYTLIKKFETLTGEGVLLNTSFNIKGEPIVCTPQDAIQCFLKTGLDVLCIGNFVVEKEAQS